MRAHSQWYWDDRWDAKSSRLISTDGTYQKITPYQCHRPDGDAYKNEQEDDVLDIVEEEGEPPKRVEKEDESRFCSLLNLETEEGAWRGLWNTIVNSQDEASGTTS